MGVNLALLSSAYCKFSVGLPGTLPPTLGGLAKLYWLYLGHSKLSGSIPSLENCTKLSQLRLDNCGFTSFPAALPRSIVSVGLSGNPIGFNRSGSTSTLPALPAYCVWILGWLARLYRRVTGIFHTLHELRSQELMCGAGSTQHFGFLAEAFKQQVLPPLQYCLFTSGAQWYLWVTCGSDRDGCRGAGRSL
jgi:hypothetical protein